jgi:hypothetical protein
MDVALLHTLYDAFAGDRSTLLYSGRFPDAHTARLIVLGEETTQEQDNSKGSRARLAFVLVEAYQNIIRHRAALPETLANGNGRSVLLIRVFSGAHEVSTMNPVSNAEAEHVVEQLNGLEQLIPEQLKERYLESLKSDSRTERGGAGLGLIEMARRSGNALRHRLSPIDPEHQLFSLQVVLEPADPVSRSWTLLEHLHRSVVASNLLLFCKGISSQRMADALERMVEQELADGPERANKATLAFRSMNTVLESFGAEYSNSSVTLSRTPHGYSLSMGTLLDVPGADRMARDISSARSTDVGSGLNDPSRMLRQLDALAERQLAFERISLESGMCLVMITLAI